MTERLVAPGIPPERSPTPPQPPEPEILQVGAAPPKKAMARLRRLPRLLVVLLFLAVVFCGAWLSDDAYVSFRTADNLVHGYGLRWNVQERVQAYTNPLWTLLFAGVYGVTREAFFTAIFLSITVSVTAVGWFAWKVAKTQSAAVLGVLVLTISMAFVDYSTSGLENPLTHLLLVLFLWLYLVRWDEAWDVGCGACGVATAPATEKVAEGGQSHFCGSMQRDGSLAVSRGRPAPHGPRPAPRAPGLLPGVLALLAALAAVNRMDSILLFLPALLYVLWKERSWRCLGWMAAGSLPLWLWLAFSLVYYGFPFPNTAYAKLNNGIADGELAWQGCYYLWNSLKFDPLTLVTIGFALAVAVWRKGTVPIFVAGTTRQRGRHKNGTVPLRVPFDKKFGTGPRRRWGELAVALGIVMYLLYIVKIGGDFMSGRYLTAPLLAAVCLLGRLPWNAKKAWVPAVAAIVALGFYGSRPLMLRSQANTSWDVCWFRIAAEHGICDEASYYAATEMGLPGQLANGLHVHFTDWEWYSEWVMMCRGLRVFPTTRGLKPVNVYNCIGRYGYYAGPEAYIVDGCALSDPLLARLPPIPDPFWRIGHFRRATPDGYLATLRNGKNVIRDPGLRQYYDHLRLITQGDLWDRRRWAAIWNMNLGRYEDLLTQARREIRMMLPYHEIALPDKAERLAKTDDWIVLHPDDPAGYRYRGAVYAAQKRPEKAIRDFSRALELEPENVYTYCNRGNLYRQQKQWAKALADYNRVIELQPDLAAGYDGRGTTYVKMKEFQQAIRDFDRAAKLDPGESRTYYSRAMAYKAMHDWQRALADFRQYISWEPVETAGYHRMTCTLAATDNLEAVYELEDTPPRLLADALANLAWILATHPEAKYRDGTQALRYAEEAAAIQTAPTAWVLCALAASHAELGNYQKAVDEAQQALKIARIADQQLLAERLRDQLRLYQADRPCHLSLPGISR